MIKLQVIGNLGRDAVINSVNGKNVINFTMAHTERFKDSQGNQKERTVWVECAYWTDRTAIVPYLKKGTQAYVEGAPDVRTYTTQDGRQGASLTLRVMSVQLLGSRQNDNNNAAPQHSSLPQQQPAEHPQQAAAPNENTSSSPEITEPVDDLPF